MAPLAEGDVVAADRVVYGFLPYWEIDYSDFQWDLLTHIAYFAVEVLADGTLGDSHHWYQPQVEALIADAHSHGVKVTLTATQFDNATIGSIVGSPAKRSALISALVGAVLDRGADGVNIDFEFVPASAKADFVTFMSELTAAFHDAIPDSHVSYAGPSVDWSAAYDYAGLALACDGVFVMAYGYHWSGGSPGPTSPLTAGSTWSKYNVSWTVEDYLGWGGPLMPGRLILGLPLYGRDWPTTGPMVPGVAAGSGSSVVFTTGMSQGEQYGWQWDSDSQCPFYVYQAGSQWHQGWVDTAASLKLKFEYAEQQGLMGIGFWALGYDAGDEQIWAAVDDHYGPADDPPPADPEPDAGGPDTVEPDTVEPDTVEPDSSDPDANANDSSTSDSSVEPDAGDGSGDATGDSAPLDTANPGDDSMAELDAMDTGNNEVGGEGDAKSQNEAGATGDSGDSGAGGIGDAKAAGDSGIAPSPFSGGSQDSGCRSGGRQLAPLWLLLGVIVLRRRRTGGRTWRLRRDPD